MRPEHRQPDAPLCAPPGPQSEPAGHSVALTAAELSAVHGIVEKVVPGAQVCVFGSRATGRARPYSDLDLLIVEPARLSWLQRADLRDLFEASDLPFRVDLVEAEGLSQGMVERVTRESIPLRAGQ